MAELRGTPQKDKYVWQARKPLALAEGGSIQQGETFTPTVEMLAAFRDLMLPVGESLRATPEATPEAAPEPDHVGSAARSPARGRREE